MVKIICPKCSEIIDLGEAEKGTYSCPYCEEEFEWRGMWRQLVFLPVLLIFVYLYVYLKGWI